MMNSKKLIVLCTIVIICVIAVCGTYIATNTPQEGTEFRVLSDQSLYDGDEVIVKLITKNETPVTNQSVNVTIVGDEGEINTVNLVTNESGMATFELKGLAVGNYTLDCVFGGSKYYKSTNDTFSQEIIEEVVEEAVTSDEPYVIDTRLGGDGGHIVFYSNGIAKFYTPDWEYVESEYESPDDFRC